MANKELTIPVIQDTVNGQHAETVSKRTNKAGSLAAMRNAGLNMS